MGRFILNRTVISLRWRRLDEIEKAGDDNRKATKTLRISPRRDSALSGMLCPHLKKVRLHQIKDNLWLTTKKMVQPSFSPHKGLTEINSSPLQRGAGDGQTGAAGREPVSPFLPNIPHPSIQWQATKPLGRRCRFYAISLRKGDLFLVETRQLFSLAFKTLECYQRQRLDSTMLS